ncbi:MAG: sulfite exporter TauE/SafE family protein [Bacteroidales bacterium]|nr:sulfite exporter TauE/SafE family protein [Bacteroidales bacterium]
MWVEYLIIILAGVLVGFINTLAGGGSVISLSLLLILGLPATIANGTNRVSIFFQTSSSVFTFWRKKMFTARKILWLVIPATAGSILGAYIATGVKSDALEIAMVVIMAFMLIFIFAKPSLWLKEKTAMLEKRIQWWQILLFFAVGWYAGFLQVGVGYFLLMALVLGVGFELVKANAVKNLIVLFSAAVSLVIFILSDQVHYLYGLLLSAGSIIGAYIASVMAVRRGGNFVRWVIVASVILAALKITGLVDFKEIFSSILK